MSDHCNCHVHVQFPSVQDLVDIYRRLDRIEELLADQVGINHRTKRELEDIVTKSSDLADRLAKVLPGLRADIEWLKEQAKKNPAATDADLDRINNMVTGLEALDSETVQPEPEAPAPVEPAPAADVDPAVE